MRSHLSNEDNRYRNDHRLNSRPLDVHRWSDHSEVKSLIDQLWKVFTESYPEHITVKPGPRPKASPKTQFKVLILDLYVSFLEDPLQWIGMHQSSSQFEEVNSRYNALHISPILIIYRKQLHELTWIDFRRGRYSKTNPAWSFVSRLRASEWLQLQFSSLGLNADDIGSAPNRECIILNEIDYEENKRTFPIKYHDDENTDHMREILMAYNDLLQNTYVDIASLKEPIVYREMKTKRGYQPQRVSISQRSKFVRRIFSRGSWNIHGRFYGGFWQQINEDLRRDIFINGNPTVEVDYKALHLTLLYARFLNEQKVWPYGDDPYDLHRQLSSRVPRDTQRKRVKLLVLQAINASSRKSAFSAFRQNAKMGTPEKKLTNQYLQELLEAFLEEHPVLERFIATDAGVDLMRIDSDITEKIIAQMTKQKIPVLTIHDSYIVQRQHFSNLRIAMTTAAIRVAGYDLFAEQDFIEVDRDDGYGSIINEQAIWKLPTIEPTEQYNSRLSQWLDRHGLCIQRSSRWGGLASTPVNVIICA